MSAELVAQIEGDPLLLLFRTPDAVHAHRERDHVGDGVLVHVAPWQMDKGNMFATFRRLIR